MVDTGLAAPETITSTTVVVCIRGGPRHRAGRDRSPVDGFGELDRSSLGFITIFGAGSSVASPQQSCTVGDG
jgi:hypothetical protein